MTVAGRVTHVLRCDLCLWTELCWAPYPPPPQAWTLNTARHSCAARWQPRLVSKKHFRCHHISQKTILKGSYHLHTRHCEPTNSTQVYHIPVPMHLNNLWITEKKSLSVPIRITPYQAIPHSIFWPQMFHLLIEDLKKKKQKTNPSENPLSNLLYCKPWT